MLTHKLLSHYDGKAYQKVLASFLKDRKPDTIIFAATSFGRDLAPRLAAELVCGVTADVTELSADKEKRLVIWSRPAMDGNIMADIVSPLFRPQVGTVRPGIFKYPRADESRQGTVEEVLVTLDEEDLGTVLKSIIQGERMKILWKRPKSLWQEAAVSTAGRNGKWFMNWRTFWVLP